MASFTKNFPTSGIGLSLPKMAEIKAISHKTSQRANQTAPTTQPKSGMIKT